jgi:KTSC domain
MTDAFKQIHISPSSRGIVDHFFCFVCDEYVWDCHHLIEERFPAPRSPALEGSKLQSSAYDGSSRALEIEFRVRAPCTPGDLPLPPPPRVVQYRDVARDLFTRLTRCRTARQQERYWEDHIRRRYRCQTVRTVCRLPRMLRMTEARNLRFHTFEEHLLGLPAEERDMFCVAVAAMRILVLKKLSPVRAAGLGGLVECQSCRSVAAFPKDIRHRNCLWSQLQ